MTVYVDDMCAPYGNMVMCHMIADTDEELRAMAQRIGVAQRWHQGDHFDISLGKRGIAVRLGAVEISVRQCAAMTRCLKIEGRLGDPEEAVSWMKKRFARRETENAQ